MHQDFPTKKKLDIFTLWRYSLTYFSQTSNRFDIRRKRDSPVSLYLKITCGPLSVKTRKTQYSLATHDPQPTTQDALPKTHLPTRFSHPLCSTVIPVWSCKIKLFCCCWLQADIFDKRLCCSFSFEIWGVSYGWWGWGGQWRSFTSSDAVLCLRAKESHVP